MKPHMTNSHLKKLSGLFKRLGGYSDDIARNALDISDDVVRKFNPYDGI